MNMKFNYNSDGLIPAIVQETGTGRVLMLAYMNEIAIKQTLQTGLMHFWSRSRKQLWLKGQQSGHRQRVIKLSVDCDGDTLLFEVEQQGGAACHTGYKSCFFQPLNMDGTRGEITEPRVFDPEKVYHKK